MDVDHSEYIEVSDDDYAAALLKLDVATCEALAVSQAINTENSELHLGFSTLVFRRVCGHAVALICAVPRSRWVDSEFENWDFACAAGQARAIMEGHLLFVYLTQTPSCDAEWSSKLFVLYINDYMRREKMMLNAGAKTAAAEWASAAEELRTRLRINPWFLNLDAKIQKRCLSGDNLMILNRDEQLALAGVDRANFYAVWDLLSQHAHVLPMSFTTSIKDGRGSGLVNEADRTYLAETISWCADTLHSITNRMVSGFPDTQAVRKGIESKFLNGPVANRP